MGQIRSDSRWAEPEKGATDYLTQLNRSRYVCAASICQRRTPLPEPPKGPGPKADESGCSGQAGGHAFGHRGLTRRSTNLRQLVSRPSDPKRSGSRWALARTARRACPPEATRPPHRQDGEMSTTPTCRRGIPHPVRFGPRPAEKTPTRCCRRPTSQPWSLASMSRSICPETPDTREEALLHR